MKLSTDAKLIAAVALAGVGVLWWVSQRVASSGGIAGIAESAAAGAIRAAGDAAVGTVKGIGQAVGIPDTNRTKCEADIAAGRWWDASFSCPAGTFINTGGAAVFGSTSLWGADTEEVRRIEAAKARADFALTDPRRVDLDPFGGMAPEEWRMYSGATW